MGCIALELESKNFERQIFESGRLHVWRSDKTSDAGTNLLKGHAVLRRWLVFRDSHGAIWLERWENQAAAGMERGSRIKAGSAGLKGHGDRGFGINVDEANERSRKVAEELGGGVEIGSEPLPEAELDENEEAPDEHPLQETRDAAAEEFAGDKSEGGEDEGDHFRYRKNPESGGEAGKRGEKCPAKVISEPWRNARDDLAEAGETPDGEEEEINRQECASNGDAGKFWIVEHVPF